MSWLERVTNLELKIITGEGSEFTPIWKNARKSRNLNASGFDFNNTQGTLVLRGEVSGLVFPFEFYFQGEDHLDESDRFDEASKDKRPWTVEHPKYGNILCQPISFSFDNSKENVTTITGELWETIGDVFPDATINVQESVLAAVELTNEEVIKNYSEKLGDPEASSISTMNSSLDIISQKYRAAAVTDIDLENVENAISEVTSAFNNISSNSNVFMRRLTTLARTPARFYADVNTRLNTLEETYQDMKLSVSSLLSKQNKLYLESVGSSIISAKSETSVLLTSEIAEDQEIEDNQIKDYQTRKSVFNVVGELNSSLNDILDTLGDFQSDNDSTPTSYTPSTTTITNLKDASTKASGQLSQIAIQSKQERAYTVPENVGIVMLVHRLLGTVESDIIREFAENNEIKLAEWLQIEKGRQVIYFI